jgi:pyrimidine operon attenuation protein/uracil phosphoribosyltransferase
MNTLDVESAYAQMRDSIAAALPAAREGLCVVGVHSGGVWVAERLRHDLNLHGPTGTLSSAFHRDDYSRRGLPAELKSTRLAFEVEGADILLVDDILFTGRTVRAALNEIFDYGRPARVRLAVLIDRGGRELPVAADFCGLRHELPVDQAFVLSRDDSGRFALVIESSAA